MDDADRADSEQEAMLAEAKRKVLTQAKTFLLQPTGFCRNCGEPVGPSLLFCDTSCRDDFQRRETREKVNREFARDSYEEAQERRERRQEPSGGEL